MNRLTRSRLLRWLGLPLGLALLLALGLWPLVGGGAAFLGRMQRTEAGTDPVAVEDHPIPVGDGTLPADLYRPSGRLRRVVLLAHGVHHLGRKEPRLARYARELARAGSLVLVPDLPDLMAFELKPRTLEHLEAAVLHLHSLPEAARNRSQVQLHGISFAGGLSLCAAGRPALRGKVGAVFAFGAHADLDRVMRFLAGVPGAAPGAPDPHPYGQAVVLRSVADRLVPPEQVEPLREALLCYLQERPDAFQARLRTLPPEARRLAGHCGTRPSGTLTEALRPFASTLQGDPALSPLRQAPPTCPVFLLHGSGDRVIPPTETQALAAWSRNSTPTFGLVSRRISHVDLEAQPRALEALVDTFRLLRFWTALLRA